MEAVRRGKTEVVSLLVKAGAALDLQNEVMCSIGDVLIDIQVIALGIIDVCGRKGKGSYTMQTWQFR